MQDPVREKLITDHLPLVRRVSERLHSSWRDSGLEISDLVACGAIGLVQAADRFDPTRGARFKTFAEIVIEGAIRDGVGRARNWFGRRAVGAVIVVHLDDLAPDGWEDWLRQVGSGVERTPAKGADGARGWPAKKPRKRRLNGKRLLLKRFLAAMQ